MPIVPRVAVLARSWRLVACNGGSGTVPHMKFLRRPRPDTGPALARRAFTLVEVTVTIALVGILAGIAANTYSNVMSDRQVSAVETVLGDVTAAQKQLASDFGTYTTWAADLGMAAASAELLAGGEAGPGEVSMVVGSKGTLGLAGQTPDGRCVTWRVEPLAAGGKQTPVEDSPTCSGAGALPSGESAADQVAAVRDQ